MRRYKIVVIGFGAIGRPVAKHLSTGGIENVELVGVLTRTPKEPIDGMNFIGSFDALTALSPDLVVEAGGGEAFAALVPQCLAAGMDVLAVSVAAMADVKLEEQVRQAMAEGGSRLFVASGAVGALDALSAAAESDLSHVELVQRKPLKAFPDVDQASTTATTVSSGSARQATLAFPKNANIAAAVALAGIGFDRTRVTVIADPAVSSNMAELKVIGAFGELHFSIQNRPSQLNPSTARLASLSVLSVLRRLSAVLVVPA